jgi:hypothetical protein
VIEGSGTGVGEGAAVGAAVGTGMAVGVGTAAEADGETAGVGLGTTAPMAHDDISIMTAMIIKQNANLFFISFSFTRLAPLT